MPPDPRLVAGIGFFLNYFLLSDIAKVCILVKMFWGWSSMSDKMHSVGKTHFKINKILSSFYFPETRVMFTKKCPQWFSYKMEFIFSLIMQRWPHRLFWFLWRINVLMILNSRVGPLGRGAVLSHVYGLLEHMEKRYRPHFPLPTVFQRRIRSLYRQLIYSRILCLALSSVSRRKSDPTLKDHTFRKDG